MALLRRDVNIFIAYTQLHARWLLWLCAFCFYPSLVSAQPASPSEYQVKAVFLYKFCLYVEWPPGTFDTPRSPLTIGIVDDEAIAAQLEALANNRTIDGRPFSVRRLEINSNLDNVQLLFIAGAQQDKLAQWMTQVQGRSLLVVTETPSGLDAGSVINFALQNNRVRFDVGLDAAQRHGLKLSAQLLQVARIVRQGGAQ